MITIWFIFFTKLVLVLLLSFAETTNSYVYVTIARIWLDAQAHCRAYYTDLVTIESSVENTNVYQKKSPLSGVWIGLYREPWTWSDNSNSLFRSWLSGNPSNADFNDFCVCEYSQHQWTDDDCALKKAFICEEGDCSLLQRNFSSVFVLITVHLTCLWFYILYSSDRVVHTTVVKIRIQTDTNLTDHTINSQVLQQVILFSSPLFCRSRNDRRKIWFEVVLNLT